MNEIPSVKGEERTLVELVRRQGKYFKKCGGEEVDAVPVNGGPYIVEFPRGGKGQRETEPAYQERILRRDAPPTADAYLRGLEDPKRAYVIAVDYLKINNP